MIKVKRFMLKLDVDSRKSFRLMIYILIFFVSHWVLSLFFHTAFLHRYGSHKMYTMGPVTEKVFYFFTWMFQGSSFLNHRAYAVMHRMHHDFSDTEQDPHSPHFFRDIFQMMMHTKRIYNDFLTGKRTPESKYCQDLPTWPTLDKIGDHWAVRVSWAVVYSVIYLIIIYTQELSYWWLLMLPIHYLIGPVQGAIVNWCGHKYGYSNFNNGDKSKNSEVWGVFLLGELFQNNHHKFPESINFAKKWFEFDPTYLVLRVMHVFGIIQLQPQKVR